MVDASDGAELFQVHAEKVDGGDLLITLTGEIDLASRGRLDEVVALARSTRPLAVRVELSDVTFLGSDGVAFLIAIYHEVQTADGELELRNPSRITTRALEITGLLDLFKVVDDTADDADGR